MADVDYAFIPKAQILASHAHANLDKDWGPFQSKDAALQSMPNTAVRKAGKKFGVVSTVGGVTTIEEYMFTKDNATDNDVVKLVLSSDDVTGTFDYTIGSTTSAQLSEAIGANKIITIGTYIASVGRVGTSSSGYYVVCYTDEDGVFHKIVHETSESSVGTETTKEFAEVETINSTSELGFSGVIGGIKKYQGNTMLDLGGVSESGTLGNAIKHLISLGVHIDADDTNNVFAIKNINNETIGSITLGTNATNGAAELNFVAGSDSFTASLPNLAYDSSNQMLKMVQADGTQTNLIKLSNLQIKGVGSTLPCWDTTATPDPVSREAKGATGAPHWAIGDLFLLENSSTTPSTFDLCVCTNVADDGTYYNYSWQSLGSINNVSLQADQISFMPNGGLTSTNVQGAIDKLYGILAGSETIDKIDLSNPLMWEEGGINGTTGNPNTNAAIRTRALKISSDSTLSITNESLYTIYCYFYDINNGYLGWGQSSIEGCYISRIHPFSMASVLQNFPNTVYVRFTCNLTDPLNVPTEFTFSEDTLYEYGLPTEGLIDKVESNTDEINNIKSSIEGHDAEISELNNIILGGDEKVSVDLNSVTWVQGGINNTTGAISSTGARIMTGPFKFTSDSVVSFQTQSSYTVYAYFYDINNEYLGWGASSIEGCYISRIHPFSMASVLQNFPNTVYVRFTCNLTDPSDASAEFNFSTNTLFEEILTEGFSQKIEELATNIDELSIEVENLKYGSSKHLTLDYNDSTLVFSNGDNSITTKIGRSTNTNNLFEFYSINIKGLSVTGDDDIAPTHTLNTTIGANHGQPCQLATVAAHGLNSSFVGTKWTNDSTNVEYYLMSIKDSNTLVFLGKNTQTELNPSYPALIAGNYTNDSNTITVTEVSSIQLYNSVSNQSLIIKNADGDLIDADGSYNSNYFDVIEEYDIITPDSIINNLVANIPNNEAQPTYSGDAFIHVQNTYRFLSNLAVLVFASYTTKMNGVKFNNYMFSQSSYLASLSGVKYYAPNSEINNSYDLRVPTPIQWVNNKSFYANVSQSGEPVNRLLRYYDTGELGFALGFIKEFGVGKELKNYTSQTFQIAYNTNKFYPHGVDSATVGDTLPINTTYSAAMYRCFFDAKTSSPRMSMYHYTLNGAEYVYIDYSSSIYDKVVLDDTFNGKDIEVIESSNTILQSDFYNGGFYVNANYVNGETCYIVVKIN